MKRQSLKWINSWQPVFALCIVLCLELIFFARYVQVKLATDDVFWLQGQISSVFDQYRVAPRLAFTMLYEIFGINPLAAQVIIFTTHACNSVFIYLLTKKLVGSQLSGLVAAWVFAINPLTLGTLTWISCYSYVLGAWFALVSLLLVLISMDKVNPWPGMILASVSFLIGLLSTHEILFLPLIFPAFGWLKSFTAFKRGVFIGGGTLIIALLVDFTFYNFEQYGVLSVRLLNLDFFSAFISSVSSFAVIIMFSYLVSFIHPFLQILQAGFGEMIRWLVTISVCALLLFNYHQNIRWRKWTVFAWLWIALILPYIIRLYLMPVTAHYHISYVLSGRVFYIPFIGLAFISALSIDFLYEKKKCTKFRKLPLFLLAGIAYINVLSLYVPEEFIGLSVSTNLPKGQTVTPSWNPYFGNHRLWLIVFVVSISFAFYLHIRASNQLKGRW